MSTDGARVELRIHGRVQGVGYRYSAVRQGISLGLRGFVRNCDDGSVEAVAEGNEASLRTFIAWCRRGPSGAAVTRLDEIRASPTGEFRAFTIEL